MAKEKAAAGQASWGTMLGDFVVPSVLGNAIGGVLLVALLNYGQVAAEKKEGEGGKGGRSGKAESRIEGTSERRNERTAKRRNETVKEDAQEDFKAW